jgi:diphthamide synthase (EF-2-diphthine--ammonia ligase)
VEVVGALTTINDAFDRVSMHGVRQEIVHAQLDAAGLPGQFVRLPFPCPNDVYESAMDATLADARRGGIAHVIFGDLYLGDVRAYREQKLSGTGITPLFPLWGHPTAVLAREMIAAGLKTRLATVDLAKLPARFAGRSFDDALLADLPDGIDPCGENGEFHTCVVGGPMFRHALAIETGDTVVRDGFAYCDLFLSE